MTILERWIEKVEQRFNMLKDCVENKYYDLLLGRRDALIKILEEDEF